MLEGVKGILKSRKAMMCVLIIAVSTMLSIMSKMSMEFAAIISTVAVIYNFTVHKIELATLKVGE